MDRETTAKFCYPKLELSNPPVLAYSHYSIAFSLHTDASSVGRGAVLYQNQTGKGFKTIWENYPANKLEFLDIT